MISLDASLLALEREGRIAVETAVRFSANPEQMERRLHAVGKI